MGATRGLSGLTDALGWGAEMWLGPLERLPLGLKGRRGLKGRLLVVLGVGMLGLRVLGALGLRVWGVWLTSLGAPGLRVLEVGG